MSIALSNTDGVHAPLGNYHHVAEAPASAQLVFISGQIPMRSDGTWAESFADQADQVFANLVAHLAGAGLTPGDVIKVNSFIVNHDGDPSALLRAREKHFGDHQPAATGLLVAGLVNPEWKLEVEAIAVRS